MNNTLLLTTKEKNNMPYHKLNNPEPGKEYIINKGSANEGLVTLVSFNKMTQVFATVRDEQTGAEWEVMMTRLSERQ